MKSDEPIVDYTSPFTLKSRKNLEKAMVLVGLQQDIIADIIFQMGDESEEFKQGVMKVGRYVDDYIDKFIEEYEVSDDDIEQVLDNFIMAREGKLPWSRVYTEKISGGNKTPKGKAH